MRLYQKKQCFLIMGQLGEVHAKIAGAIRKGQIDEAAALLGQCQQGAIQIGGRIEAAEGEGTQAVHCLEEYCELAYRSHEELRRGTLVYAKHVQEILGRAMERAKDSLRRDIRTQREVVFMPYKATMWDSLGSVWKAADEDPDCHAVVVPIPYYDKEPDGSLGEMHDETDQFPEDVPVVRYDAYDLEGIHPDMIFIHNPYDDGNCVTSVHPFFYSKDLKRYTDELVYIPYFILGEIDPSDQTAVEEMEHLCTLPGVIYADHVVVQSEGMRQIYVDILTKYLGERTRSYWERKILGLGSPKADRVCSLQREDFELPDAWERLIRKDGGGRRRVVFYNTGLGGFLRRDERMLEKIRRTFRMFREHRGDVTLLWRPHPLTEATLGAMRPQLARSYESLVQAYKEEGWGIYDDSADMYRAIAVSDGYYGDWSSIVWLYKMTGKPIMIQDLDI